MGFRGCNEHLARLIPRPASRHTAHLGCDSKGWSAEAGKRRRPRSGRASRVSPCATADHEHRTSFEVAGGGGSGGAPGRAERAGEPERPTSPPVPSGRPAPIIPIMSPGSGGWSASALPRLTPPGHPPGRGSSRRRGATWSLTSPCNLVPGWPRAGADPDWPAVEERTISQMRLARWRRTTPTDSGSACDLCVTSRPEAVQARFRWQPEPPQARAEPVTDRRGAGVVPPQRTPSRSGDRRRGRPARR